MKFLLIEDDQTVREVILHCLSKMFADVAGFEIFHTSNLEQAKELYITRDPHTVLLDLTLEDSTQLNTIQQIPFFAVRSDVVIISGDTSPMARIKCFSKGCSDYLDKLQVISREYGHYTLLRMQSRFAASYYRSLYGKRKDETA